MGLRAGALILALAASCDSRIPDPGSRFPASITCISTRSILKPRSRSTRSSFRARRSARSPGSRRCDRRTTCWCCSPRSPRRRRRSRTPRSGTSAGTSPTCARALDAYKQQGVTLVPLYTGEAGGTVFVSSDTWPGSGGVLGLTRAGHRRREGERRQARWRRRVCLSARAGRCAGRVSGQHAGRTVQSRAHVPGPAVLRAALVPETPQRPCRRRPPRQAARTEANCRVERSPEKTFPALDWDGMYRRPR